MDSSREDNWTPSPGIAGDADAIHILSTKYGLPPNDDLLILFDTIRLRTSRETIESEPDQCSQAPRKTPVELRQQATDRLKLIIDRAGKAEKCIKSLHNAIVSFEEYGYPPHLMQQISHVGPGGDWYADKGLDCIDAVSKLTAPNSELRVQVEKIINFPARDKRPRARVAKLVLQRCAMECRDYWCAMGRTWKTLALDDNAVTEGNDPKLLEGCCERFFCDVLSLVGLTHTLGELKTAMNRVRTPAGRNAVANASR